MFMDQTIQKVDSFMRLRPANLFNHLRNDPNVELNIIDDVSQYSQSCTPQNTSFGVQRGTGSKPDPSQRARALKLSPLKVRKTRENLSSSVWKSDVSAPNLDKHQAGGELKFRETAAPTTESQSGSNCWPRDDAPSQSRRKENHRENFMSSVLSPLLPPPPLEIHTSSSPSVDNDSSSTLNARMMNFTAAQFKCEVEASRKTLTTVSAPIVPVSKVSPPVAPLVRRPSQPRRSFSESQRSDGLRSRVVTQVRAKLRKSSKKDKDTQIDGMLPLNASQSQIEGDSQRSQSRVSEWVSTDAVISEARSEIASSEYSELPQEMRTARRLSLDGAMAQISPYHSSGTLPTSGAASRLSSVFTPTPSGTKATTRTSIFESPSRQLMPSFEHTAAVKYCPSFTFRGSLSVACDSDSLHFAAEKNEIWASIELRGEVVNNDGTKLNNVGYGAPSLAVAIVVENSAYASPIYLQRACSQALGIATQLRGRGDQLAIYATVTPNKDERLSDYEVCSLTAPDLMSVRRELNTLICSQVSVHDFPQVGGAVTQAADALRRLDFAREHDVRNAQRVVILIAPHSIDCKEQIPSNVLDRIQLHHLSAGIIPSHAQANTCFDWFINSPRSQVCDLKENENEDNMQYLVLDALLSSSRYGSHLGSISNVVIDVIPGPETTITDIVGNQFPERLLPGQAVNLLVKMNVKSLDKIGEVQDGKYQASFDGFTISRAFDELEKVLKELSRELITVRVSYRHNQFPENTSLEMKEVCWMRRPAHASRGSTSSILSRPSIRKKIATHNAVAITAAAAFDARDAITRLMLNARGLKHADGDLLSMLRDELFFQKDVDGEKYLLERFQRQHFSTYNPRLSHRPSQLEISTAKLRQEAMRSLIGNSGPNIDDSGRSRFTDSTCDSSALRSPVMGPLTPMITPIASKFSDRASRNSSYGTANDDDEDPARQVWRQMRQVSKGRDRVVLHEEEEDEFLEGNAIDEKLMMFKREALRNRRSIGNDTLKSMARSLLPNDESSGN